MHAQLETGNLKNIQLPVIPTVLVPHSTLKAWFLVLYLILGFLGIIGS
jgi:hypothetical protein